MMLKIYSHGLPTSYSFVLVYGNNLQVFCISLGNICSTITSAGADYQRKLQASLGKLFAEITSFLYK